MDTGLGPVYAILSAAFIAASYVLVRRATHQSSESFTALAVSLLVGAPLFIFILFATGEWGDFFGFTWQQYLLLIGAGWLHYLISRFLYFNSVRIIGANPTAAIIRTSVIFSVIVGVVWLNETMSAPQVIGALVIMLGAILSSVEISQNSLKISVPGLMLGLGTAIGVTGSAALVRIVMATTDAVFAATFVSYLASFLVIAIILVFRRPQREQLRGESLRNLSYLSIAAVVLVVSHIFRYLSFEYSPISVAQPLTGTIVIFTLIYSFVLNRRIDVFHWQVVVGILMVLAGVFLISGWF